MAATIEQYLDSDERLLYRSRPTWKTLGRAVLWALFAILVLIVLAPGLVFLFGPSVLLGYLASGFTIAVVFSLVPAFQCYQTSFGITDRRLIYKFGRDLRLIDLSQVRAVDTRGRSMGKSVLVIGKDGRKLLLQHLHQPLEIVENIRKLASVEEEPVSASQSCFRVKFGGIVFGVLLLGGMFVGLVAFLMMYQWLHAHIVGTSSQFHLLPFLLDAAVLLVGSQVFLWLGVYLGGFLALTLNRPFLSVQEARKIFAVELDLLPSAFMRRLLARILSPFKRYVGWLYGAPAEPKG